MKTKTRSNTPKRGGRRKRVVPLWRRRWVIALAALALTGCLAGSGWWLWSSGWVGQTWEKGRWELIAMTARMGFRVEEILVVGRHETSRADLLKALRLARGAPILSFDPHAAKARVERLPWVHSARVERMLPDTVLLQVIEREPLALWQRRGAFALIDADGVVIDAGGLERFADLLIVVGEGAPERVAGLMRMLETQPHLLARVRAAVWVGGRRWNLRLDPEIDVRLPEDNPAGAWKLLADYQRTHRVLEKDVRILDLRLPDRLIVRRAGDPDATRPLGDGQDT